MLYILQDPSHTSLACYIRPCLGTGVVISTANVSTKMNWPIVILEQVLMLYIDNAGDSRKNMATMSNYDGM